VVTRPAISLVQDRESSPARTGVLTTVLRNQLVHVSWTLLAHHLESVRWFFSKLTSFTRKTVCAHVSACSLGEKPFACPYTNCGRSFTTSNIRKVHIRTHTGERPFYCEMPGCGKTFASATNYKNHIRIHSGISLPSVCYYA